MALYRPLHHVQAEALEEGAKVEPLEKEGAKVEPLEKDGAKVEPLEEVEEECCLEEEVAKVAGACPMNGRSCSVNQLAPLVMPGVAFQVAHLSLLGPSPQPLIGWEAHWEAHLGPLEVGARELEALALALEVGARAVEALALVGGAVEALALALALVDGSPFEPKSTCCRACCV